MKTILFSENYLDIHKLDDAKCILMEWKAFAPSIKYRHGLNKGLEALKESNYSYWLADLRKMKAIALADQEWANNDWFPRALNSKIEKMAIIVSEDSFNKMAVNNIMSKVPNTALVIQYFNNSETAMAWLKESATVISKDKQTA